MEERVQESLSSHLPQDRGRSRVNTLHSLFAKNVTLNSQSLSVLLFKIFFLMWTIFKVFIEFVTILLLFYILVFWPQVMWNLTTFVP